MENLQNSLKLLTSIKGIGKNKAKIIIAYCGSPKGATKNNSLLARNKLPGINDGQMLSERIKQLIKAD